jgi:hypothetical protein
MKDEMGGVCNTCGEIKNAYKILVESFKGSGYSEDLDVDGSIILRWVLGK